MTTLRSMFAAGAALLLFAPPLFAAQGLPGTGEAGSRARTVMRFETVDRDHDGCITRAEANQSPGAEQLAGAWPTFDLDYSGQIDATEFSAFEQMQE